MKILLVHNNYGTYSGEEAVVDRMACIFREYGHEICFYRLTTEGVCETFLGKMRGFFSGIYSFSGVREMNEVLNVEKPDVVNVHNLYPFISPAALFECTKAGIPVVMTIHNYRLICPTGLFMRNGRPCELCLQKGNEWQCIRYNCEHSFFKSVGYTLRNIHARWIGAYRKNVNIFACITEFQKRKLIEAGYDANQVVVIPNSIETPDSYSFAIGKYIAYIGRLSYEKGYDLLIEVARRHPKINFYFAGAQREQNSADFPENVKFAGYLQKEELAEFIQQARFIVIPSRCYEGFPMAILEAACYGKPVIAPNHGGFTEIIGQGKRAIGKLFVPDNIDDLDKQIVELWNDQMLIEELGGRAFSKLKDYYDSEVVYRQWEALLNKLKNLRY